MEDLIDQLTSGNVEAVKVVLASVVAALAVYQVVLMAVGYGKLRVPFLKPKAASFTHRASGDSIVAMTLLVAFLCLAYFGFEGDHRGRGDDASALHMIAGALLVGALALKIVVVRWWHTMNRYLPAIGLTVFALFVVTWFASAASYLWGD